MAKKYYDILVLLDNTFKNANDPRVFRTLQALQFHGFSVALIGMQLNEEPLFEEIHGFPVYRPIQAMYYSPKSMFGYRNKLADQLNADFDYKVVYCNDFRVLDLGDRMKRLKKSAILVYDSHEFLQDYHLEFIAGESFFTQWKANFWRNWEKRIELKNAKQVDFILTVNFSLSAMLSYILKPEIPAFPVRNIAEFPEQMPDLEAYKPEIKKALEQIKSFDNLIIFGDYHKRLNGLETVYHAMQSLPETTHLIHVGNDKSYGYFKRLAEKLGVLHRMIYIDRLPHQYLKSIAPYAKIGLIPTMHFKYLTLYYSLPNKFFDSIKLELPLICTNLPEHKMIIDQFQNGLMTDGIDWERSTADTIKAFQEIMNNFTAYKEKAMKANASLTYLKEYEAFVMALKKKMNVS